MGDAIKAELDELRQRTMDIAECIGAASAKNKAWLLGMWLERREDGPSLACSFCMKPSAAVGKLIAGPDDVFICNECVGLCRVICEGQGVAIEAASGEGADGPAAATVAPEPPV